MMKKIVLKDSFRHVPVEITRAPVFSYVFSGLVVSISDCH